MAAYPEDRRRLVAEPELLPVAIEEFLRAYSPVTMARLARHDTSIDELPGRAKDERVILSFPAANRDPAMFENPDEVIIDREKNRHVAFGAGPHRCAGSNLARMEMQVAIGEFLQMIPEFELADPDAVTWAGGQVRGPRKPPRQVPHRTPTPTRLHNWPLIAASYQVRCQLSADELHVGLEGGQIIGQRGEGFREIPDAADMIGQLRLDAGGGTDGVRKFGRVSACKFDHDLARQSAPSGDGNADRGVWIDQQICALVNRGHRGEDLALCCPPRVELGLEAIGTDLGQTELDRLP